MRKTFIAAGLASAAMLTSTGAAYATTDSGAELGTGHLPPLQECDVPPIDAPHNGVPSALWSTTWNGFNDTVCSVVDVVGEVV